MFEYRNLFDRPTRDPFGWDDMLRGFDRLFRELDRDLPLASFGHAPGEITEEDDRIVIRLDVPGVADKDAQVNFQDGVVTITAERRATPVPDGYAVRRRERSPVKFSRSYALGDHVDTERTAAELKDGVLTVTLPKSPAVQKRAIPVKAS
jgi:HSP20 family protein